MKKRITLIACVCVATVALYAKPTTDAINKSVEAAVSKAADPNTHDTAVVDMVLTVESAWAHPLNSDSAGTRRNEKPCSAVRIDNNWLMASLTCRGVGQYATALDHNGNMVQQKEVAFRKIIKAEVRSKATHKRDQITPDRIFVDEKAQIMLLHLNVKDKDLMDEMSGVSIASLLIPQSPVSVKDNMTDAYINRERVCTAGRCSDRVGIDAYCVGSKCYKAEWEWINGDAGDPLFVVKNKKEYLAGFNNAEIIGTSPESGRMYRSFTADTKAALQRILKKYDSNAWNRVNNRIKTSL